MFVRFTKDAKQVVVTAQEESRMLGHGWIGTEHFLLGLLAGPDSDAKEALMSFGATVENARRYVEEAIGRCEHTPPALMPFTRRAKRVLDLSLRESLRLGQNYISPAHILLALFREGEGIAMGILSDGYGLNLNLVHYRLNQSFAPSSLPAIASSIDFATLAAELAAQACVQSGGSLSEASKILQGLIDDLSRLV